MVLIHSANYGVYYVGVGSLVIRAYYPLIDTADLIALSPPRAWPKFGLYTAGGYQLYVALYWALLTP